MRWFWVIVLVTLMAMGEGCRPSDTSGLPRGTVTHNEWSDAVNPPGGFSHKMCVRPEKKERDGVEPDPMCVTRNTPVDPWKKCQVSEKYPLCTEGQN